MSQVRGRWRAHVSVLPAPRGPRWVGRSETRPSMRIARVAWLILGLLVASCAPASGATTSAAGPRQPEPAVSARAPATAEPTPVALVPITVHNFGPSVNTAIIQYGVEHGYYRDEGLDVTLQIADSS